MSVIGLEMPHTVVTVTDWQTGRLSCLIALKELVVTATLESDWNRERRGGVYAGVRAHGKPAAGCSKLHGKSD